MNNYCSSKIIACIAAMLSVACVEACTAGFRFPTVETKLCHAEETSYQEFLAAEAMAFNFTANQVATFTATDPPLDFKPLPSVMLEAFYKDYFIRENSKLRTKKKKERKQEKLKKKKKKKKKNAKAKKKNTDDEEGGERRNLRTSLENKNHRELKKSHCCEWCHGFNDDMCSRHGCNDCDEDRRKRDLLTLQGTNDCDLDPVEISNAFTDLINDYFMIECMMGEDYHMLLGNTVYYVTVDSETGNQICVKEIEENEDLLDDVQKESTANLRIAATGFTEYTEDGKIVFISPEGKVKVIQDTNQTIAH